MIRRWSIRLACLALPLIGWLLLRTYPIAIGFSTPHFNNVRMMEISTPPLLKPDDPSLRNRSQIRVEMVFVREDAGRIKVLLGQVGAACDEPPGWPPQDAKHILLSDASATAFRKSFEPQASIVTAPRVTIFNSQSGFCTIISCQAYVLNACSRQAGRTAFTPDIDAPHSGILTMYRPDIVQSGTSVQLHMRVQHPQWRNLATIRFPDAPPGTDLIIQRPEITGLEIMDKTILIPDGQTALFLWRQPGSLLDSGNSGDTVALMVKTTIIPPALPATRPEVP
ncbi:MAG: hypothetical protein ACHRHE_16820 [Tepidisphaerales bacterium]